MTAPNDDRSALKRQGRRLGAWTVSVAAHVIALMTLLVAWHVPQSMVGPKPIPVALAQFTQAKPPRPPPPEHPKQAPAAKPLAATHIATRPVPAPPNVPTIPAAPAKTTAAAQGTELTDSEYAGAAQAGEGAPGGGCDIARRVQAALRKDPIVRDAVAHAPNGRAIMVWNGDWVQSGGEDGKGLAAVREAITWEVAFAPKACRTEPQHGLMLLSVTSAAPRLAVGTGRWRWSDLLGVR